MFRTLTTLISGANARAEDRVRDVFALELIDEKIRQAEAGLKAAKATLASLIQRQRAETRARDGLRSRLEDMTRRTRDALAAGRSELAEDGAKAIAQMENELAVRDETLARLDARVLRLQSSVEAGHRRILDLRQGATQARAVRREQQIQGRLGRAGAPDAAVTEAEELIGRVLGRDDPFEAAEILRDIDEGLAHEGTIDRMAAEGFGPGRKTSAADVLARLAPRDTADD